MVCSKNNIEFLRGADAVSADASAKTVTLSGGETLSWDQLVLATGAVPRHLDLADEVKESGRVHVLVLFLEMLKDSAHPCKTRLSIAIIGGGYIGLEVAASAKKRGLDVTVIEMAPRILARVASPEASQYFHDLHISNGTKIMTNAGVKEIATSENGLVISVDTENGPSALNVDLALLGIGVVPDLALAESLGLSTGMASFVDGDYRSNNIDDVWAIGDVALAAEGYTQGALESRSVHHAQMSAEIASAVMMGMLPKTHEVPWFWSEQYDKNCNLQGWFLLKPKQFRGWVNEKARNPSGLLMMVS